MCEMSAFNICVSQIFFILCFLCIGFSVFAIYQNPNNWNSWIMLPAQSRSQNVLSENSIDYQYEIPLKGKTIPVFYNSVIEKTEAKNKSKTFLISIENGKTLNLVQPNGGFKPFNVNLFTSFAEKVRRNTFSVFSTTWYNIVAKFIHLLESFIIQEKTHVNKYQPRAKEKGRGKKIKIKKLKKFILPLLLAYKLKFFALIPVLIGGLLLLVGSTGMAGFFFALFAAVMSLKSEQKS